MIRFVIKRILKIIPILLGATFIVFSIMSLAKGDIADTLLSDATEEEKAQLREELGLDGPLVIRYGRYIIKLFSGDMGTSYKSKAPVSTEIAQRFPYTLALSLAASLITLVIAIPLGMLAAIKQNSVFDSVSMALCLVGVSMPAFWVGLLLMLLFSLKLGWLPVSGSDQGIRSLILPALTQAVASMASIGRQTRSSMVGVLRQDYIRTARAKGLPERTVIFRHAMKNAMLPTITAAGLQLGGHLCGGVITETVFAWPGIGRLLVNSISWRDTPCVLGCVVVFVLSVTIVNLIVDVLYGFIDPRIKAQYKKV